MQFYRPFTASDFANWVFESEVAPRLRPSPPATITELIDQVSAERRTDAEVRRYLGYLAHYTIEEIRRDHLRPKWNATDKSLWTVDYCDKGVESEILESSALIRSADGKKLRGKPDLVLTNLVDSHVIIFERKTTNKSRDELLHGKSDPSTWPNCWAQLWAYTQLDKYTNIKTRTLVLQPWYWNSDGYLTMGNTSDRQFQIGDQFDKENIKRFHRFGGMRIDREGES